MGLSLTCLAPENGPKLPRWAVVVSARNDQPHFPAPPTGRVLRAHPQGCPPTRCKSVPSLPLPSTGWPLTGIRRSFVELDQGSLGNRTQAGIKWPAAGTGGEGGTLACQASGPGYLPAAQVLQQGVRCASCPATKSSLICSPPWRL